MNRRRAITTIETIMAMLIMAAALTAVAQFSAAIAHQQRLARQRLVALQEASNLMEQLLDQTLAVKAAGGAVELSPTALQLLPQAEAAVEVSSQENPEFGEHVVVTIHWQQVVDGPAQHVRLAGWRYPPRENSP